MNVNPAASGPPVVLLRLAVSEASAENEVVATVIAVAVIAAAAVVAAAEAEAAEVSSRKTPGLRHPKVAEPLPPLAPPRSELT